MSNVVGLVKSRLRSKSRRDRSLDGVDVVVDDGHGLVRYRSLRQEALADPVDDSVALSPTTMQSRTPNELDPALLAEGLHSSPTKLEAPPVPPLPSEIPSEYFPARESSLQNRRPYAIKAHRRASSHTNDGDAATSVSPESQTRRRHYTISSPGERPRVTGDDYFQSFSHSPPPLPPEGADAGPSTLTAKLYGTIAENQRSTEPAQDPIRPPSRGKATGPIQDGTNRHGPGLPQPQSVSLAYRPRAATFDERRAPIPTDADRPAPLRVSKNKEPNIPEHVRLPDGFELTNDERTSVNTAWHPAVEQRTIKHERREVVHPVIEKDVHVHHYYEYEQPIMVTEVLPPKHYRIDAATDDKVEITSPTGWQMPQPLTIQSPNTSQLRRTQRHYLVNDDHPDGKLEDWPLAESGAVTTWI